MDDEAKQRLAEVVERSRERTDSLLDRACALLDSIGVLEDEYEEEAIDDSSHIRPRHSP